MSSVGTHTLEAMLRGQTPADKPEVKAALLRLSSELNARAHNSSQGSFELFARALRTLRKFKGTSFAELRLKCLFECAAYFYNEGAQGKALESVGGAFQLATASGDLQWLRKAHNFSGAIYADMGNVGDALIHYARALELCIQLDDTPTKAMVLINTGVALNYAGLYREAIPCFERCEVMLWAPPGSDDAAYRKVLVNHAQSLYHLEQFEAGFQIARKALAGLTEPMSGPEIVSRVIKEFTFVQLALEVGEMKLALEHGQACVRYARRCESLRAKVIANIALGLCEVHAGVVDKGLALLEDALEKTTPGEACWLDAIGATVRGYDAAGDPGRALGHMKVLMQFLRTQRKKSLAALLQFGGLSGVPASQDLHALELREARLEARVAVAEAAWQRIEMLERLAVTADVKEESSGEHGYRVGRLCACFARTLGWEEDATKALELAARLHDIGKIAMPDRILLSSKELQAAERHFMSTHTTIGAELLGKSNIPQLRMAEEIARHHHEWWNGEGYPSKLKGKRIPIHARIVAIADVFDALTHGRPFSPPWSIDKALAEITARRGTQFDPELTDVFLELIGTLRNEHEDLDEYLGRAGRNSPFLQARNRIRQMLADERDHEKMATVEGNATQH